MASRTPCSTAGIHCRGTTPPVMRWLKAKPEPRGCALISMVTSPNWPWPPVCFLCRACWVTPPETVSRYGVVGGVAATSTPKRRLSRSSVSCKCVSLWPLSRLWWVSASWVRLSAGSSSISLASALDSLTSSWRALAEIARL